MQDINIMMKRLSSFGFLPAPRQEQDKRPKLTVDSSQVCSSQTSGSSASASEATLDSSLEPITQPQSPESDCQPLALSHRNDLGSYTADKLRSLSDVEKLWLLRHAHRPDQSYKFPRKLEYGKNRSFQYAWLTQCPWLTYSEAMNGGFCVYCVLFARHSLSLGQLVTTPMVNFTRAKVTLQEHNKQSMHKIASIAVVDFVNYMEKGVSSIDQQVHNQASKIVSRNRLKMLSILKTIVLCGKQMIPLRGHREHGESSDINTGNFLAFLKFRVDAGDSVLDEHFRTAARNAQYHSPHIQNDLIACVGEWIRNKILEEVRCAKYFSICADEAADCSNQEQLPMVLRFVDKSCTVREEFVDFILCDESTTGVAIAGKILERLNEYGLNLDYLRGQAYDGAGNMAGRHKGTAAIIQRTCPKAVYVHCAAHSLNLCIVSACSVQLVKNMMGIMVEIELFFSNSPKRQHELEKHIELTAGTNARKLVGLCKTRWVARVNALEVFFELYEAVVHTFEAISEGGGDGWNSESCRAAEGLLMCIRKYQFVLTFVVTKQCLQYTKGLTVSLQKRANDICQAYTEVNTVLSVLKEVRTNIEGKHRFWNETAVSLGEQVNAQEPQIPRRCSAQTSRSNTPGETPEVYYRRTLSIPFIDDLISHMSSRFADIQQKAISGMKLVPSVLIDPSIPACNSQDLLDLYADDLPASSSFETELELWKHKWQSQSPLLVPDSPSKTLHEASKHFFPNIHVILRLVSTIPVTSCESERSISVLRRLKTFLRSTIGQERLSGLALMHIQYGMDINYDEVINIFARKHPRRLQLLNILEDDS